ncbi:Transposon Ty3-I Gag-Pol polyprotein [Labeo rohita]|uniref:ribonuclease H n=1 Tax=Labeo rohita TaxID=84645 RepID=A0ABQ8L217_LABRO|nr:Transposon Ty3-I Gag-Pol polyprotein [Labeo rohita]
MGDKPEFGSQAHQQSALQVFVQDDNAETDPGAHSPQGLICIRGLKGRVLSHASLHQICFLRFAFKGTAYQYSVLPFEMALAPHSLSKCMDAALSPLRMSYLDDWLILAHSRDVLVSHLDTLLHHLESLGQCVNLQKSILILSQSITYLGVCFNSVEILDFSSTLRLFRLGSSVHLKEFKRLLGLMAAASAVCHLGILHMRLMQLWLKSRAGAAGCIDLHQQHDCGLSNAHSQSPKLQSGHAYEERDSSRRVEVAPQASFDFDLLRESGGGSVHHDSQTVRISPNQDLAAGVMKDQGGEDFCDTRSPNWLNQPWFSDLAELLVAPPWPIPSGRICYLK